MQSMRKVQARSTDLKGEGLRDGVRDRDICERHGQAFRNLYWCRRFVTLVVGLAKERCSRYSVERGRREVGRRVVW